MRLGCLVLLAGCDGVFGLTHIPDRTDASNPDAAVVADANPLCERDMFTDASSVFAKWIRVSSGPGFDTTVDGEQLIERVPANAAGATYVRSTTMYDMTDATATLEVTRVIGLANSETYFAIQVDIQNFYLFDVVDGMFTMRLRVLGVDKDIALSGYDATGDHFWRFQHKKALGQMLFFTSDDGATFTMRHVINTELAVGPMRVEIGAATNGQGLAIGSEGNFDNFEFCPP